jgi:nucleoside phosphorylase/tetratricopeptide (TPR) repeat protein
MYARTVNRDHVELERSGAVRRCGNRTAVQRFDSTLGGYTWGVRINPRVSGYSESECERVLAKQFKVHPLHNDEFVASEVWGDFPDNALLLLEGLVGYADGTELRRRWELARALRVDGQFIGQLSDCSRQALAANLLGELLGSLDEIDLLTDLRLNLFIEGLSDEDAEAQALALLQCSSRLKQIVHAKNAIRRVEHVLGDEYVVDITRACVHVLDAYPLGDLLQKLPPGKALLSALEAVCTDRPELLATYVWHCAYPAEGAFVLLQLSPHIRLVDGISRDLMAEWTELQQLGREQLLLGQRLEDGASVVDALWIDQSREMGAGFWNTNDERSRLVVDLSALLVRTAKIAGRLESLSSALMNTLQTTIPLNEITFVLGLRVMDVLASERRRNESMLFAETLVDVYAASHSLDIKRMSSFRYACEYGTLLAKLQTVLQESNNASVWAKWLNPFELDQYLDLARNDEIGSMDSTSVHPWYHVPALILSHAELLVAQAVESELPEDSLFAAVRLYSADEAKGGVNRAFSWDKILIEHNFQRARKCPPIFVGIGKVLARLPNGVQILDTSFLSLPKAYVLAQIALGAGTGSDVSRAIGPTLQSVLNENLRGKREITLGYAVGLGSSLLAMGDGRNAERCAREALEICAESSNHYLNAYRSAASAILAGALAVQEAWPELSELDSISLDRGHSAYVKTLCAVAHMELGQLAASERLLLDALKIDPKYGAAHTNLVALRLRAENWSGAIDAAEASKRLLPEDERDPILVNEALARAKTGDTLGATRALSAVRASHVGYESVFSRLTDLYRGVVSPMMANATTPDVNSLATGVLDASPELGPRSSRRGTVVDVAIITALPEEFEAIRSRLVNVSQIQSPHHWHVGEIATADGSGKYRVICARTLTSGNLKSFRTVIRAIDEWNPRYVVFSGIAGGLHREGLNHGDVVVSSQIWHYEYGKISDGRFDPRQLNTFRVDSGLLGGATHFGYEVAKWKDCASVPPRVNHVPKAICGVIGSGEKVIDDLTLEFVKAILDIRKDLQAVEMEAAGASEAIECARDEGAEVGFIMVRGISDMPAVSCVDASVDQLHEATVGTASRTAWKQYASEIAANFVVNWIRSNCWPQPPRGDSAE